MDNGMEMIMTKVRSEDNRISSRKLVLEPPEHEDVLITYSDAR